MTNRNYTRTITVSATPAAAYQALTSGFELWWTKPDRPIAKVGDRAKFTFPPGKSYWTFKASLLVPDERVELVCVDALHLHAGRPAKIEQEWLGSKVIWQITQGAVTGPAADKTDIHFEHQGLTPDLLCFDVCEEGWDFFFVDSLSAYLDTGKGKPHQPPTT